MPAGQGKGQRGPFLTPGGLRRLIQIGFAAICVVAGWRLHLFLLWARGESANFVPRPPVVEGFLPISALLGLKRLLLTGEWDMVHPAGLTILITAVAVSLLARKGFCGYICPVGLLSNGLERLGRRLGLMRRPENWSAWPRRADRVLMAIKYVLLAAFVLFIARMGLSEVEAFLRSPYNLTADARMLAFFQNLSGIGLIVLAGLAFGSLVIPNFWCRYACPYGALLGLVALSSPVAVRRDAGSCTNCGRCSRACPMAIRVQDKVRVNSPECMGCLSCVQSCAQGSLTPSMGNRSVPWPSMGLAVAGMMICAWLLAEAFGLWQGSIPQQIMRMFYTFGM